MLATPRVLCTLFNARETLTTDAYYIACSICSNRSFIKRKHYVNFRASTVENSAPWNFIADKDFYFRLIIFDKSYFFINTYFLEIRNDLMSYRLIYMNPTIK